MKDIQTYYCKNCDAVLYWDTKHQSLHCEHCGAEYFVQDFKEASSQKSRLEGTYMQEDPTKMVVYECENCNGEVI